MCRSVALVNSLSYSLPSLCWERENKAHLKTPAREGRCKNPYSYTDPKGYIFLDGTASLRRRVGANGVRLPMLNWTPISSKADASLFFQVRLLKWSGNARFS